MHITFDKAQTSYATYANAMRKAQQLGSEYRWLIAARPCDGRFVVVVIGSNDIGALAHAGFCVVN